MSDTIKLEWTDWRGKPQAREVKQTLDVRDFIGTPGYALLVVAANTHLSVADILYFVESRGVGRSRNWIQKRRWLFQLPGTKNPIARPDGDGRHDEAIKIMAANPTLSLRNLALLLKEHGITRGREWLRQNRVTAIGAATDR